MVQTPVLTNEPMQFTGMGTAVVIGSGVHILIHNPVHADPSVFTHGPFQLARQT